MKEQDYINVTDLAKLRIAKDILRDCSVTMNVSAALNSIYAEIERLTPIVSTDDEDEFPPDIPDGLEYEDPSTLCDFCQISFTYHPVTVKVGNLPMANTCSAPCRAGMRRILKTPAGVANWKRLKQGTTSLMKSTD